MPPLRALGDVRRRARRHAAPASRASAGPLKDSLELRLLGVGAMRSPRFAPAGLLLRLANDGEEVRVAIDGGEKARVGRPLAAWLVTDERAELISAIRRRARSLDVEARVARFESGPLAIVPRRVRHTSHPTYAYEIRWRGRRIVWAPEFWRLPRWVAGADMLFADAAGWSRPIHFRGGVGGHAAAVDVAERARALAVRRLIFAHIGRPTIRALRQGERPRTGEIGRDGQSFRLSKDPSGAGRRAAR